MSNRRRRQTRSRNFGNPRVFPPFEHNALVVIRKRNRRRIRELTAQARIMARGFEEFRRAAAQVAETLRTAFAPFYGIDR